MCRPILSLNKTAIKGADHEFATKLLPPSSLVGEGLWVNMVQVLCCSLLVASLTARPAAATDDELTGYRLSQARLKQEQASTEVRHVFEWVIDSKDNHKMPFAIVDKVGAKVFVFDANGRLLGAAPALLGLALGDDAVPGIGTRVLSSIRPE